ncbi:hypothetical protein EDD18DRAFT_1179104 [Armillaria luteobubalina]|uniref:Protein kinase domain-containing protein n=1 Tax=Armillaria luteobubalina TaxID=153913 RepID=A0AA39TL64_9AGAR|nr:hypothetical protein EDD18DRAFT_1179104 [Armillaria luteobubalina]
MPSEIMDDTQFKLSYITARDVYSLGCTVIEICTGEPPFPDIQIEAAIITGVLNNEKQPDKPPVPKRLVSLWSERPTAEMMVNLLPLETQC